MSTFATIFVTVTLIGYQLSRAHHGSFLFWPGLTFLGISTNHDIIYTTRPSSLSQTANCPLSLRNPPPSSQHERTLRFCSFTLMSHSSLAAVSSSNFQIVINNALKVYKKRTKKDLLSIPLASELQACNSSAAILAVLQQQVKGLEPSQSSDDRRTKWLVPTVKVLYTYSATLEERVGLVSLWT